jgi:hypothetical protein
VVQNRIEPTARNNTALVPIVVIAPEGRCFKKTRVFEGPNGIFIGMPGFPVG